MQPCGASCHVEVVETADGFTRLRDEWTTLLASSPSNGLFVSWEWLHTWWTHLSEGAAPFIVTVRHFGELVAIAPLMRRPGRVFRPPLSVIGCGDVGSDYIDVIARRGIEELASRAVARMLTDRGLVVELPRLRCTAVALHMADVLGREGWTRAECTTDRSPYIPLAGVTWDQYLGTLSGEHRYNFKRRLRNLHKAHVVRFEQIAEDADREAALDVLIHLHNRRWSGRGGSTAFHKPELIRFHHAISKLALERGWLRLFVLRLDDRPAAALYGFTYNARFYFYQSGFDDAFARLSVGLVTMGLAIGAACAEHVDEFDMLHGEEPYKFLWAQQTHELVSLEMSPPHFTARVRCAAIDSHRAARRLVRRWLNRILTRTHSRRLDHERSTPVVPTTR